MLLDRVSNPGPLTYESDALPIVLRGPATKLPERIFQMGLKLENRYFLIQKWQRVIRPQQTRRSLFRRLSNNATFMKRISTV